MMPYESIESGSRIADFVVEERVSLTSCAAVYRARRGEERAAVKVYAQGLPGLSLPERIRREREAQSAVSHPCVARLLDWGQLDHGSAYTATSWIDGPTLEAVLGTTPLAAERLVPIIADIGRGLSAIHKAGIIHRDLKPSNVLVPLDGPRAAVIVDLGHSLVLDDARLTDSGFVLGSASYMAPEQAKGMPLDGRADLYALGVILYRGLTGSLPFLDPSPAVLLQKHRNEPVEPPSARAPHADIPRALEDLCLWLLAKSPDTRVPNTHVLTVTLKAIEPSTAARHHHAFA